MIAASVTAAISAAAVAVAARQLVRLGRLRPPRAPGLEEAARGGDPEAVAAALDELFPSGWSPSLADALLGKASGAAVAELNEVLGDIDGELRASEGVPRSATRIALFAGAFGGIVELLPTVGAGQPSYGPAVAAAGFGILGAILSAELGRRSKERVGDVRSEWDQVATAFSRRLGKSLDPVPARRRRSR